MIADEATIAAPPTPGRPDNFVKDANGRTIFYPTGTKGLGYVVPDADREQKLRAAFERARDLHRRLLPLLPPAFASAFYGAYMFFGAHPFLVVAGVLIGLVLFGAGESAWRRSLFGTLYADLPRVGTSDPQLADRRKAALSIVATVAVLTWFVLRLYDWRLGRLPVADGRADYYADISLPLLIAAVCGLFLIATTALQDTVVARAGNPTRFLIAFLVLALVEAGCLAMVSWDFVSPTPQVVVTRDGLWCRGRVSVRWRDVTAIAVTTGRRGTKFAELEMGTEPRPPQPTPFWTPKRITRECETTGLNVDYDAVDRAMLAMWRQAHGLAGDGAVGR